MPVSAQISLKFTSLVSMYSSASLGSGSGTLTISSRSWLAGGPKRGAPVSGSRATPNAYCHAGIGRDAGIERRADRQQIARRAPVVRHWRACSPSIHTPSRRTGSGGLTLSMNWRMPVLPPSGSTIASANNAASRASPAAMPCSSRCAPHRARAHPPCRARPSRAGAGCAAGNRPAAPHRDRCRPRVASGWSLPDARRTPCPADFPRRAARIRAPRRAPATTHRSTPSISTSTSPMSRAAARIDAAPPRIRSSASRTPSAPRASASRRGSRCVPP